MLLTPVGLPRAGDLEGVVVDQRHPSRTLAVRAAQVGHEDPARPAVHRVRTRVARFGGKLIGLDGADDLRLQRVRLCVEHVGARGPDARHDQVTADRCGRGPHDRARSSLEGDQTGQELLGQALRVLDPAVCGVPLEFEHYDLSLENRRRTGNEVVLAAARAMREAGYGIKAATITPEGADDVGSPNKILREAVDGRVIIRAGGGSPV